MLELQKPVYFGNFHRFKAYQFDRERFNREWLESYGCIYPVKSLESTIFVQDAENTDCYGLPEIVFQDWSSEIDSLDQVIAIVKARYPEAFQEIDWE